MKTRFLMMPLLLAGMALSFVACGDDENDELPGLSEITPYWFGYPVDTVSLTVAPQAATAADKPILVTASSPGTAELSLSSAYNDPDGTTFHAEPKVHIQLSIDADTARVEHVGRLGATKENDDAGYYNQGDTTTTYREMDFSMGNQKIHLKYTSEEIKHANSNGENVYIPYLGLNGSGFNIGEPRLTEIVPATQPNFSQSTGKTYDVRAVFTVDFLSTHASIKPFTLYFEIQFIAVTERTPDGF